MTSSDGAELEELSKHDADTVSVTISEGFFFSLVSSSVSKAFWFKP